MNDRDYMKKLIQLIESAENVIETPEPVYPWKKLFEYNLQATLKNFAPRMIASGIYGVLSSMSKKGAFSEKPGAQVSQLQNTPGYLGKLNGYKLIAHKLIQAEVHKKFAEHQQSGKVKQFIDSDSIAQVDRAVDAYKGGHDEIDLELNHPFRSMGDYGDPNPDDKENAPWPGPDGETGGYPPGPRQVRRQGFSLGKKGSIEKHTYNARQTGRDTIPGDTGYLDLQPLGTFSNAGLGRATPLHVWAGGSSGDGQRDLVGYRSKGSNFEINPLFNEIMNDPAFQNKFATTFLKLIESFDPTPQKRYTLPILKFFLKQEFYMNVGVGDSAKSQPGLAGRPGTVTTFPKIEDMRSTHFEDLAWFDQNKQRIPADKRDINQYESINEFHYYIESFRDKVDYQDKENPKIEKDKGDSDKIYTSESADVYWIKDREASCHIGQGTRWCTAAEKSTNYFAEYNAKGPLLIVNFKKPTLVTTNPDVWAGTMNPKDIGNVTEHLQSVNRIQMNLTYGAGKGASMQDHGDAYNDVDYWDLFADYSWEELLRKIPYGMPDGAPAEPLENTRFLSQFIEMANAKDIPVYPIVANPMLTKAGIDLKDQPFSTMWLDPKFHSAIEKTLTAWQEINQHPMLTTQFDSLEDQQLAMAEYEQEFDPEFADGEYEDDEDWVERWWEDDDEEYDGQD